MKKLEKISLLVCVLAFLTASAITISAENRHRNAPVIFTEIAAAEPGHTSNAPREAVNINTADSLTLQTLTGIGPVLAERIIEFRQTHGSFENLTDIIDVSGIGVASYEKIKDQICIN